MAVPTAAAAVPPGIARGAERVWHQHGRPAARELGCAAQPDAPGHQQLADGPALAPAALDLQPDVPAGACYGGMRAALSSLCTVVLSCQHIGRFDCCMHACSCRCCARSMRALCSRWMTSVWASQLPSSTYACCCLAATPTCLARCHHVSMLGSIQHLLAAITC